jgi:hypothetical protein
MSASGPEFTPLDVEFAVIGMAEAFSGADFPNDRQGLHLALIALQEQHDKVQPPVPDLLKITEVVIERDPIIKLSEQMAAMGTESEDYELALAATNNLFAFGEADYQDSLGGDAFGLSVRAHRDLARHIVEKYSATDPYLRVAGLQVLDEALADLDHGDAHRGLKVIRGLIHTVALNGTLGEAAKAKFDPYALLNIQP